METNAQVAFPSVAWFQALQARMNSQQEKYRDFGFAECKGVFRITPDSVSGKTRSFGVTFSTYECTEVCELGEAELSAYDADWVLEGPFKAWAEMIANIKVHGKADSDHTLNRLSLLQHPFRIGGSDQTRTDIFFRQQLTFQEFIDESAAVATVAASLQGAKA